MEPEKQESENTQPRKRYKLSHYVLEFFMILLAVTVGFFVDDYREYRSEREEEIQYLKSLLDDLKKDRLDQISIKKNNMSSMGAGDTLAELLTKSPVGNESKLYHYFRKTFTSLSINYSDRTVEQLKSSGKFRIIQNQKVSNAISDYDLFMRRNMYDQNEVYFNNMTSDYVDLFDNIFDLQVVFSNTSGNEKLLTYDRLALAEFRNKTIMLSLWDLSFYYNNTQALKKNIALDSLIRVEYKGNIE